MSRLILFSGGVESTAMLTLARPEDTLLTIGPTFPGDIHTARVATAVRIAAHFGHAVHHARADLPLQAPQFVHQMRVFVSLCNLWVAKDRSIIEVWCGRNSAEPGPELAPFIDQMMHAWAVLHPAVPFLHPTEHLTKRQQWDLIPPAVRPLVSTCMFHRTCGTCPKCRELVCLSENSPSATSR